MESGVGLGGPAAPRELVNGIEIAVQATGEGSPVLCIHETAATAAIWEGFAEAAAARQVIRYDRRGWGATEVPQGYRRTTVGEQAEDAVALLRRFTGEPAVICGAGLGGVVALDLALRRPEVCAAAVVIEPPLLAFLPQATNGLSADLAAVEEAVGRGGADAAFDLYASGGLPYLGAGAGRLPAAVQAAARARPGSLFAELAAVADWEIRSQALLGCQVPVRIVVGASTPPVLRLTAEELAARVADVGMIRLGGDGLPHVTAAPELARAIADLA